MTTSNVGQTRLLIGYTSCLIEVYQAANQPMSLVWDALVY